MKKKVFISLGVALIAIAVIVILVVVKNGKNVSASDLMEGITANAVTETAVISEYAPALTDFSVRFFKRRKIHRG